MDMRVMTIDTILAELANAIADNERPQKYALMQALRELVEPSEPDNLYAELARLAALTYGQVASYLRLARKHGLVGQQANAPAGAESHQGADGEASPVSREIERESRLEPFETYQFGADETPAAPIPEFKTPELTGDFVVVGDVHCPATDWDMVQLVARVGERWLKRPRRLLVAGDFFNMATQAKFRKRLPTNALETELAYGERVLERWFDTFDTIFMVIGNHDAWLLENFEGELGMLRFKRMLTEHHARLEISPYSAVFVTSGNARWFIPHQANYSRRKLAVANSLAMLEHANVIATHQHFTAVGRDDSNRYTVMDIGGLHQPQRFGYPFERPSNKPKMNKGFCLLVNGCGHLITPYPTMTDLSMWDKETVNA